MPSVWTRSADELHREYVANTEAFYRAAGRSCAAELDGFMRKCALWLWKSSPAVTQAHVDAYNALCSKGREPGDALLWDLTGKVCSAQPRCRPCSCGASPSGTWTPGGTTPASLRVW